MSLEDYISYMERCSHCSSCKWVPFDQIKSWRFSQGCPSIAYSKFNSYSARGKHALALSLVNGWSDYSDKVIDVVFKCLSCGSCDVSDKICRYNMEPLELIHELRAKLVQDGQIPLEHMVHIEHLKKEDNMLMQSRAERGRWADNLDVKRVTKEACEVVFHAGCRFSYDKELQKVGQTAVTLLKNAGVDIGIMGDDEGCCGDRAFCMGYEGEFVKFAQNATDLWKNAGVKTIVTSCADCFHAFTRLYPPLGTHFEVMHTVQYLERLITSGAIKFTKKIPMKITYHDPCHLGRQGETWTPWEGKEKKIHGQVVVYEPKKPRYNGAQGVYDAPRTILQSIPGIELVEMERNREYAWCCGAGGGAKEAYPDFSMWTAKERIEEAKATGAEAIVTCCGWCERNFIDAINENSDGIKVYDLAELVNSAI